MVASTVNGLRGKCGNCRLCDSPRLCLHFDAVFQRRSTCVSERTGQTSDETKPFLSPSNFSIILVSQSTTVTVSLVGGHNETKRARNKAKKLHRLAVSPPMLITDTERSRISISSVPSSSSASSSSSRIHTTDVSRKRTKYPAVSLALYLLSTGTV